MCNKSFVQPRPLAVNMSLPAFAAAERCAVALLLLGAGARRCRSISPCMVLLLLIDE